MKIVCLGSGSSGNAYLIKSGNESVLCECGFRVKELKARLAEQNETFEQITSVVATHRHIDHIKGIADFEKLGVKCYLPFKEELPHLIKLNKRLLAYCFPVQHDCSACGFLFVDVSTRETCLFIDDTDYFELEDAIKEVKLDYVCIECNHIYSKLKALRNECEKNGDKKIIKYDRQSRFHLSLINTKKMLNQLSLNDTKAIYLMHNSEEAGDPKIMKEQIEYSFKIKTFVCNKLGGTL